MENNKFQPLRLFILAVCLMLGLLICGFALDAILGRTNDELWARVVRWVSVFGVIFGIIAAFDTWKRRSGE